MELNEPSYLDYFSGGVPTGEAFRGTLEDIRAISLADHQATGRINRLQELCLVGLVSYFEAFCKDHFAFLLNVEPGLVANLKAAGHSVVLDATYVIAYGSECGRRLGFMLSSGYDSGLRCHSRTRCGRGASPAEQ